MKKVVLVFLVVLIGGMSQQTFAQKKKSENVVCFKSDMDCSACEKTVYEYLKFEKGVKDLKVDHASNTIYIKYKDGKNSDDNLSEAIVKKGYKADKISEEEYEKLLTHVKEHGHEHSHEVHKERKKK